MFGHANSFFPESKSPQSRHRDAARKKNIYKRRKRAVGGGDSRAAVPNRINRSQMKKDKIKDRTYYIQYDRSDLELPARLVRSGTMRTLVVLSLFILSRDGIAICSTKILYIHSANSVTSSKQSLFVRRFFETASPYNLLLLFPKTPSFSEVFSYS